MPVIEPRWSTFFDGSWRCRLLSIALIEMYHTHYQLFYLLYGQGNQAQSSHQERVAEVLTAFDYSFEKLPLSIVFSYLNMLIMRNIT